MKEAVGIFVLKTDSNGKTLFSTFTNFLDLKNFTSYMSDKNKSGIEVKKAKAKQMVKNLQKSTILCHTTPLKMTENIF